MNTKAFEIPTSSTVFLVMNYPAGKLLLNVYIPSDKVLTQYIDNEIGAS